MEAIFYGGLLRLAQALLQAAPFIAAGLLTAGVFRRLLGPESTRRFFGGNSWRALPQAWAIGMLLPVCSLGAIPVIRELRRSGLSGGTILAFALAAPLFNPLSLLYGLTLSDPLAIVAFAFCSLVVVTGVGLVWDRMFPNTALPPQPVGSVAPGLGRLVSVGVVGAREMAGGSLGYILLGLCGIVLLSTVLPPGTLQSSVNHDNPWAPLLMAAVALPAYATPMTAMSQLGMMFQHGNSVGAAFTLLVLGAGANFGLLAWAIRSYGWKRSSAWMGLLLAIVIGLSYGIERPLYPDDLEPADHTHAFDIYCRPFSSGSPGLAGLAITRLREGTQVHELFGIGILALYSVVGLVLRLVDRKERLERWLEREMSGLPAKPAWYNLRVPGPALGAVALALLVATSVVGCYAYFPAPDEVLEEMRIAKVEALGAALAGERRHAERWIPIYEDWTRKLQVGVYLRDGGLSEYHRMKARVLQQRLELLEHEVAHEDREEIRRLASSIQTADARLRTAFLTDR